ncbi:sulfurtransferase TusA family protein [Alicyclobacillus dauci]|uniref:Sulfurtransferase TusA family protein n=1 Tax=Alicyclobacillus dauci TaxID=1475485 RepID=A0ABY6Z145_9BACL|nr:sulfurtransferase TusA family protein [Alicyclobacillus dauci]WAH36444.1 sulfurtransferase TusA family protein [Alicyclobacillus dauci]
MNTQKVDKTLDCKGLSCPMPIVRTKKAMEELTPGQVLEVLATDPGSVADMKSWANRTGHQFIGTKQENDVYKHYVRKSDPSEEKPETRHPDVVSNEDLLKELVQKPVVLDVREPMEYAFGHIPGAKSVPLGQLEEAVKEMNPEQEVYVICRTGNRSDAACQILAGKGFSKVRNVVPGMSQWTGPTEQQ